MADATRRKVLVVDDEDDLRKMIMEFLESQGFEVLAAANGLESLLQVKRERPSDLVLDLRMPRLGGIEALKRIRAFDPSIAAVVITGERDPEVHQRALGMGALAVLTKPFALDDLLQALGGAPAAPAVVAAAGRSLEPAAATGRILIVDDEVDIRAMLVEYLGSQGYAARSAADGWAAVEAARSEAPDVILLDFDMPGLDGIDALSALRAVAPAAKVIMVSGISSLDLARETLAHGAFDFVAKPIDFGYLTHTLQTALTLSRLEA